MQGVVVYNPKVEHGTIYKWDDPPRFLQGFIPDHHLPLQTTRSPRLLHAERTQHGMTCKKNRELLAKINILFQQDGPLPVINGVINPINGRKYMAKLFL